MVYANQNHSREFSNRKTLIVCASVFEILDHNISELGKLNVSSINDVSAG